MGGDSGGAEVRGQAAAGAQGAAEPEAATAQVAAGGAGGAEGSDGTAGAAGGGAGAGVTTEAGSDAAGKARAEYEAALKERDARIAELEGEITEAAKTAESAERLRAEMDELRRQGDAQRVSFELQLAGARNVKAATALLADYDGDVEKLKAAEDRVANCGVRKIRYRNGLRPRISFDQEKDSRGRRTQWKLYSKTPSR